jgi:hypothetical protein
MEEEKKGGEKESDETKEKKRGVGAKGFCDLPAEMQVQIVSYCEMIKDRCAVAGTCKQWREELAGDVCLWKRRGLFMDGDRISALEACRALKTFCPGIKALTYTVLSDTELYVSLVERMTMEKIHVKRLSLRMEFGCGRWHWGRQTTVRGLMTAIVKYAVSNQELESVHVDGYWSVSHEDRVLPRISKIGSKVRELSFDNWEGGCEEIGHLLTWFPNVELLCSRNLFRRVLKSEVKKLAELVSRLKVFYHWNVYSFLGDKGLAEVLSGNVGLQALSSPFMGDGCSATAAAIRKMGELQYLCLDGLGLNEVRVLSEVCVFERGKVAFLFLTRLELCGWFLDEEVMRNIAENCPNLRLVFENGRKKKFGF